MRDWQKIVGEWVIPIPPHETVKKWHKDDYIHYSLMCGEPRRRNDALIVWALLKYENKDLADVLNMRFQFTYEEKESVRQ